MVLGRCPLKHSHRGLFRPFALWRSVSCDLAGQTTLSEEGGMQVAFYDWTTYWDGALEKGQGSLPRCVLHLLEAARDDDYEDFAAQARSIPYLELTVAQVIFERIEELHREEPGLDRPAEAIGELVDLLVSEEANRNAA